MRVRFWLSQPVLAFHRVRYWCWEKLHPEYPWLCPGTIRFLGRHLTRSTRALEFGSGRSTVWLAGLIGHITSVEYDRRWFARVQALLEKKKFTNVDYRHLPLEHPAMEPERPDYEPMPAYVRVADEFPRGSLDLVVVDGHYRTHCVRRAVPRLRPGGLLLVDDVNRWPSLDSLPVPAGWVVVDDSGNGMKRCVIWRAK